MTRFLHLLFSCYLILFVIGGGRVCGCEALSLAGFDVHHHHEDECETHHEEDGHHHDCCEMLEPFEATLPEWFSLPDGFDELAPALNYAADEAQITGLLIVSRSCWKHPATTLVIRWY